MVTAALCVGSAGAAAAAPGTSSATAGTCAATANPASRAYSPIYDDDTLQVFSRSGNKITSIATVPGMNTPGDMVVTGDGSKLYVDDWGTGTLRVVDACTLKTTKLIPVGGFSITSYIPANGREFDGRYLYVSSLTEASISVVDTTTDTIVRRYLVPGIAGLHISPDGKTLYAVTALGVLALNPATGQQVAPFLATGTLVPTWMTETPDGSKLYLADTAGDAVSVVNAHTMKIEKTISFPFGTSPIVAKVSPDGTQVWIANGASAYGIVAISTATDTVTKVIPTNGLAAYVSFSPDSKVAYVAETGVNANSSHLGVVYLVAAATKLVRGPGDIRPINTSTYSNAGPVVPSGQVPGDLATVQPGVVSGG